MSNVSNAPKFLLCIDWETSGAVWGGDSSKVYQGLSFGAIVADALTFEPIEKLYIEIKYNPKWGWTEEAAKIHGLTREYLEEYGISQVGAAVKLAELILKYWGPNSKVMFMGHNAEFDRRFTNQLLNEIDIEFSVEKQTNLTSWIQLHHVILDTSPLGFITLGQFKSDLLFDAIGYEKRGDHNSLTDAEQTLGTAKAIKELIKIALEVTQS